MAKTLVQRGLRRVWRSLHALAFEGDQDGVPGDRYAYRELNACLSALLREGGGSRPNYAWGTLHAAHLAGVLGIRRISVLEFGVASGSGLLALERIAAWVGGRFAIGVDVYGFDTGRGLPPPADYRDSPNLYVARAYAMQADRLRRSLKSATLSLGLVEETVPVFLASNPAPIGFISFDLDYYSSTKHAIAVLAGPTQQLLPRVHCYFDDVMGFTHGDFTGERLAIAEFNAAQPMRKLSPLYGLRYFLPTAYRASSWPDCIYLAHIFDHDLYGRPDGLIKDASPPQVAAP